jgi:DNA-binding transcriptional MerR regulator
MDGELASIGPVAARVGLSVRTIRYYEEMGLVTPSGRSVGGFRLYDAGDVARLMLIKRMKPLGYPLEAMAELLALIDSVSDPDADQETMDQGLAHLRRFGDEVVERVEDLRTKLAYAEEFRDRVLAELARVDAQATTLATDPT